MNINNIKTGDIYLVKSKAFMSKAICYFMKQYAKTFKVEATDNDIYSHAGTLLWINDTLYIAESIENGFHLRVFDRHYGFNPTRTAIFTPVTPYSKDEVKSVIKEAIQLTTINITYQFWNFIQWPIYIWTKGKINLFGKKDGRKITYCYEGTQRIKELVRPGNYNDNPEITNIFMLTQDKNFKRLEY